MTAELYNKQSTELGTLKSLKERLFRHSFTANIKAAYDPAKEFINSVMTSYLVAALMNYFGMEGNNDPPTKHKPPENATDVELKEWFQHSMKAVVKEYYLPGFSEPVIVEGEVYNIQLANGHIRCM